MSGLQGPWAEVQWRIGGGKRSPLEMGRVATVRWRMRKRGRDLGKNLIYFIRTLPLKATRQARCGGSAGLRLPRSSHSGPQLGNVGRAQPRDVVESWNRAEQSVAAADDIMKAGIAGWWRLIQAVEAWRGEAQSVG